MPVDITSGQINAAATVGIFLMSVVTVILAIRNGRKITQKETPGLPTYFNEESPKVSSISGVPTLEQLTQCISVDPKDRQRARWLYDMGLEQYNHYMNNRDGVLTASRLAMKELKTLISEADVSLADDIGMALASRNEDEHQNAHVRYEELKPEVQIYAQHRRREYKALQTIANDLRHNVPRTDYTSVRSRVESGAASLGAIISELPIPWQELRNISATDRSKPIVSKPPKRVFVHTVFFSRDKGILEDKRAEKQGNWLYSHKFKRLTPYQEPLPVVEHTHPDRPPVPTGKRIAFILKEPGSEWATDFWRQGGYLDQQFILARDGRLPAQLRRAYRRRQLTSALWSAALTLAVLDIAMITLRFT